MCAPAKEIRSKKVESGRGRTTKCSSVSVSTMFVEYCYCCCLPSLLLHFGLKSHYRLRNAVMQPGSRWSVCMYVCVCPENDFKHFEPFEERYLTRRPRHARAKRRSCFSLLSFACYSTVASVKYVCLPLSCPRVDFCIKLSAGKMHTHCIRCTTYVGTKCFSFSRASATRHIHSLSSMFNEHWSTGQKSRTLCSFCHSNGATKTHFSCIY